MTGSILVPLDGNLRVLTLNSGLRGEALSGGQIAQIQAILDRKKRESSPVTAEIDLLTAYLAAPYLDNPVASSDTVAAAPELGLSQSESGAATFTHFIGKFDNRPKEPTLAEKLAALKNK